MEDYVNVNFFWGGEIIRRDNDIRYSRDPKEMRYIKLGTSYDELKEVVFAVMQINPYHWNVKLSYKYPQLGLANLITGYYLANISSDDDVRRMLSIPRQFQMGMGDVSVYIEAEKIILDEPYSYDQPWYSQPSQQSYNQDYGTSQHSELGTTGWSDQFFCGGFNNDSFNMYGGGSSSQAFENPQQTSHSESELYEYDNVGTELSPPRNIVSRSAGMELARIDEADEHSFSSEDSEEFRDDEDDSEDEEEEVHGINVGQEKHHVPRVSWFETEEYTPITVNNHDDMSFVFDPQHAELSVGSLFRDKETLVSAVRAAHISSDRNYHVERSTSKLFKAKCIVPNCPWKLRAAKKEKHALFEITVCPVKHTCLVNQPMQDHRKISQRLISRIVKPHVMETPNIKIKNVIEMVNDVYNHRVNYNKAWRGKQLAIEEVFGNWTTTYAQLPMFMTAMTHANPGSIVEIDAARHNNGDNRSSVCKRIFWCLKAMMDGWQHARPVISIDGTFLKGKYNGKLLVAMGVDSNNHQYPICYGLVDEESYENWSWFLQLLRKYVCRERLGVCIISDRAAGILAAMRDDCNGFTEPFGVHRFCLFRVRSNFCNHHPGKELRQLMWLAGITPQVRKHETYMKRIGEISPPALQYLKEINPELWTMCHDTGGARYGQASTNIMEGFNGNIRMARFLPVTAMMEYLFYKTVRIMNTHRNNVEDNMQNGEEFCSRTTDMLTKIIERANAHRVETFSRQHGIFSVVTRRYQYKGVWKGNNTQVVNIQNMTCTCGKWTCHHLPCSHVVAGCNANGINWKQWIGPYHYTSNLKMVWEPLIYPMAPKQYWNYDLPRRWQHYGMLVPNEALRKKKKKRGDKGQSVRIRTEMDRSHTGKKCSRCKQEGHTKRSKRCPLLQ